MSHSPIPCESVCLLNRFHNNTVLNKYGSSQKGLRTRKKTKDARLSKLQEHVSPRMEDTNIIDFVTGALRFSVVSLLHLIFAAVTMVFFVLSNVCKSVVIFSLFFRCHDLNGHKATQKHFSSRQPRLIVNLSVA